MMDLRQKAVALATITAMDLLFLVFGGLVLFGLSVLASLPLAYAIVVRA